MRNSFLLPRKLCFLLLFFVLQNCADVQAITAISVPTEMKWVVEDAKGEYWERINRTERYRLKKYFAQQIEQVKTDLAAAEKEYGQIKTRREQLTAAYKAAGVSEEKYRTFEDVRHIYEEEHSLLSRVETLRASYKKTEDEQAAFLNSLKNLPVYGSFFAGAKYYGWKDTEGDSGHQFLIPFGVWMGNRDFSIGVYGNYVSAKNDSANGYGSINTLADTTLRLTKNLELSVKEDLEFSLGVNLPTGTAALNFAQRNARMSDDLVEIDKFGAGWEFNPGLKYSWRTAKHDKWSIGTNFLFTGYYDRTSDIMNDDEKAGREWRNFIRYQHAEEKRQFIAELHHTSYNRSFNKIGYYYDTDDEWLFKLTYNKRIANNQELALYYWPTYQTNVKRPLAKASWANFYGVRWSRFINKENTLRVSFDVLKANGMRYAGLRSWYDTWGNPHSFYNEAAGRDKYTIGVGYDRRFGDKATMSLDVKYFLMHDGATTFGEPPTRYKGFNIFLLHTRHLTFHW